MEARPPRSSTPFWRCFIALFTLLHMSELIEAFNPVQLLIMPMMFVLALLMAIDSVKLCKEK